MTIEIDGNIGGPPFDPPPDPPECCSHCGTEVDEPKPCSECSEGVCEACGAECDVCLRLFHRIDCLFVNHSQAGNQCRQCFRRMEKDAEKWQNIEKPICHARSMIVEAAGVLNRIVDGFEDK